MTLCMKDIEEWIDSITHTYQGHSDIQEMTREPLKVRIGSKYSLHILYICIIPAAVVAITCKTTESQISSSCGEQSHITDIKHTQPISISSNTHG